MSLALKTIPDPVVRQRSRELERAELATPALQNFIDQLVEAMIAAKGIGIAAPQVGHPMCVIIIDKEYTGTDDHVALINPRIVSRSAKTNVMEEGCLSVPGVFGEVERATKVRIKAWDRDGKPVDWKAKGMLARIFQHEVDHLHGIVFIDRAITTTARTPDAILARKKERS